MTNYPSWHFPPLTLKEVRTRNKLSFMAKTFIPVVDFQVLRAHLLTSFKDGFSPHKFWNLPTRHLFRSSDLPTVVVRTILPWYLPSICYFAQPLCRIYEYFSPWLFGSLSDWKAHGQSWLFYEHVTPTHFVWEFWCDDDRSLFPLYCAETDVSTIFVEFEGSVEFLKMVSQAPPFNDIPPNFWGFNKYWNQPFLNFNANLYLPH